MNKQVERKGKFNIISFLKNHIKEIIFVVILVFALLFAAYKIFGIDDGSNPTNLVGTETEQKVARLLQEIDGVGKAEVIVCENEDGVQSVVVVCEGANDFRVVMDVREAVAAALGTQENNVKIYLKKE